MFKYAYEQNVFNIWRMRSPYFYKCNKIKYDRIDKWYSNDRWSKSLGTVVYDLFKFQ